MNSYGDPGAGVAVGFLACYGFLILFGLAMFVLTIWMLVDAINRQEWEYPGSTGSSKNLWVILLAVGTVVGFGWIVALVYYFQVFKVLRRGTVAPPWAQQAPGGYQPYPYQPPVGQTYAPPAPPAPAPPAPPVYTPPAQAVYAPPAPPAPPSYEPPAPAAAPETPAEPQVPPAPPAPPEG